MPQPIYETVICIRCGHHWTVDEAARQIIGLVTGLYGIVFDILAFATDPVPAYLARGTVRLLGLLAVVGYLLALLGALLVVAPGAYCYARASQTQRKQVFDAMMRRKLCALRVALGAFGVASVAFALLFVVVLFGL